MFAIFLNSCGHDDVEYRLSSILGDEGRFFVGETEKEVEDKLEAFLRKYGAADIIAAADEYDEEPFTSAFHTRSAITLVYSGEAWEG